MPDIAKTLAEASVDQLVDELLKRAEVVPSVWGKDDVLSFVADDENAGDLSEEQIDAACAEFLDRARNELASHLGGQGNQFLMYFWERHGEDILKSVTAPSPAA